MALVKWYPYRGLANWEREVSNMLDAFGYFPNRNGESRSVDFTPASEVIENEGHYTIRLELPGVAKEDVKVDLTEDVLTVQGQKKAEQDSKADNCHCTERIYGTFARSYHLPKQVDGSQVKAEYRDGVLTLTLPKSEKAKPKQIAIQ